MTPDPDHKPTESCRSEVETARAPDVSAAAGAQIGRYRLIERLGEGGFGEVWRASQSEPVRREVAVKLIKPGMDSREVLARFEGERQALALMDHRNVARILDGGLTPDHRPYFVMELVRGVPLLHYCDLHRLSIDERLGLFLDVCAAVQHAHAKAVIHRDIKPSNVLVAVEDGESVAKVIDFGIAKSLAAPLTDTTRVTRLGSFVGTPTYMSPEQADFTAAGVDTRTDIYSLGVVLYEMLTGALPLSRESFEHVSHEEFARLLREVEPPRPSTRVRTIASQAGSDQGAHIAHARRTPAPALVKRLRGDLDWITLRCLEKDPSRRYQTVAELALDIERHLAHQPVAVAAPSTLYRAGKFARRHRLGLAAAGAVVVALLAGTIGTTTGWMRARAEAERARQEAAVAKAVNDFLNEDLLATLQPEELGRDVTMREALDVAARGVGARFQEQPLIEAAIRGTLGRTYRSLGELGESEEHLRHALDLARTTVGESARETLAARYDLGLLMLVQARIEDGVALLEPAYATSAAVYGAHDELTLLLLSALGEADLRAGRALEAEQRFAAVIEGLETTHGDPLTMVAARLARGTALAEASRFDEAEPLLVEAAQQAETLLGAEHPTTLAAQNNLGSYLSSHGKLGEAERWLTRALDARTRVLGEDHPNTLVTLNNLALLRTKQGRLDEAETLHRRCLDARTRIYGRDNPRTMTSAGNLGLVLLRKGRYDEAASLFRESIDVLRRRHGEDHPEVFVCYSNLGTAYQGMHDAVRAEDYLRRALDGRARVLGEAHLSTAVSARSLASFLQRERRHAEAMPFFTRTLAILREVLPGDDWRIGMTLAESARSQAALGRDADAESAWRQAHEILVAAAGESDERARAVARELAEFLATRGRGEEASVWRQQSESTPVPAPQPRQP